MLLVITVLSSSYGLAEPLIFQSSNRQVSLLELYTSEGCSSCPPADRWLSDLKRDPRLWRRLVPVAFHVDYWDSIGWPDRFAAAAYGDRQRFYASQGLTRTVYTPGFFLNGAEWRQWFSRQELALDATPAVGRLRLTVTAGQVDADFDPAEAVAEPLELHVAVLGFDLSTRVQAGENRGRTLRHDFVVLGHEQVAMKPRDNRFIRRVELPKARFPAPQRALAAWVSRFGDPRPLQAVGGWLDPVNIP
jgi:hypothetical protein